MLLSDVIARFSDPDATGEALLALNDLVLVANVRAAADAEGLTAGELALRAIGRFADVASDDTWLSLVGAMGRAEDPGRVFLRRALADAMAAPAAADRD